MFALDDEEKQDLQDLRNKDKSELEDEEITRLTHKAVRRKFEYPEYAVFEEFSADGSRLDLLGLCLYKSRGFETIGFEVKASRSDWKRELENPSKNDYFVRNCDKFYVVAGRKGIVKPEELPKGWGLYEMKGGGKLYNIRNSTIDDSETNEEFYWRMVKKAVKKHKHRIRELKYQRDRQFKKGKKGGMKKSEVSQEILEKAERMEKLEEHNIYARSERSREKLYKAKKVLDYIEESGIDSFNNVVGQMRGKVEFLESNIDSFEDKFEELRELIELDEEVE